MKWIRVIKDPTQVPATGTYRDWKELLAVEGQHQCVYCAIHESIMGGVRNFHVEHYRPKKKFAQHVNDYLNLYYSCPICNTFKSNDWPNEPEIDHSIAAYPNPSDVDYNELFTIVSETGSIQGLNTAAKYIQERLYLNRPQLVIERRIRFTIDKAFDEIDKIKDALKQLDDNAIYREYSDTYHELFAEATGLLGRISEIPHYGNQDVKRA